MHARIDRQNRQFQRSTITATNWKTRPEGYNRRNELENVSTDAPWPLD
jgi:hypothetical protein